MIEGKTSSGFEFSLNENVLDNMELVDALAETEADNPLAVSKACLLLLGPELRKKLYNHLRTEDGRVPVELVSTEMVEIFSAFGKTGKNS